MSRGTAKKAGRGAAGKKNSGNKKKSKPKDTSSGGFASGQGVKICQGSSPGGYFTFEDTTISNKKQRQQTKGLYEGTEAGKYCVKSTHQTSFGFISDGKKSSGKDRAIWKRFFADYTFYLMALLNLYLICTLVAHCLLRKKGNIISPITQEARHSEVLDHSAVKG